MFLWLKYKLIFFFFWPCHTAYRILIPQSGLEPRATAVKAQSPNHWTAREFPQTNLFKMTVCVLGCIPWKQRLTGIQVPRIYWAPQENSERKQVQQVKEGEELSQEGSSASLALVDPWKALGHKLLCRVVPPWGRRTVSVGQWLTPGWVVTS